jgi:isoquinoline 1-oxidoreductase beta subunit
MLIQAAAERWQVAPDTCRVERSMVFGPDGRKASFGQLAEAAGKLAPPDPKTVVLKPEDKFARCR